ncbi:MAG: tRNA 2-thiouridine(34) synthase MnmA [Acidimicrobiia bacterium]|nr:tRNA 2-thiouridine(34) synthase MnmA [Acidimicrobiia bacterium]MYC57185.1 tRNA 2-thiouridine(34) synthase MnmA [Acidimicrobiia bacterium]MYG93888.1 tRNA 2-thiouridine(34) synthase MnmA [Acidimicrobiia bacterium]MYI29891.1 tRNA 2-thiouridine(34) synthase MnmA [Acidimicrobiia bacterium]
MRVLVAMSGGVDSSVAAAVLSEEGHDVVGVTLKLWGGESDTGCCSVSDTEDARRVADRLGVQHHVFNFGDAFDKQVVAPYVQGHSAGLTPNPCIECNRHIKFEKLLMRAEALGFDAVATGHHVRLVAVGSGYRLGRGLDAAKDQSYVLYMLGQQQLSRLLFPIGHFTKAEVRQRAEVLGLRNAAKPDSQDVCFVANRAGGRQGFLERHLGESPGVVVDSQGKMLSKVASVQSVTIGQRRGLNLGGTAEPRYVTDVNLSNATITVGCREDLYTATQPVESVVWADAPVPGVLDVQVSAHGKVALGTLEEAGIVRWQTPQRRVAPGQAVVFYQDDLLVGGALAV